MIAIVSCNHYPDDERIFHKQIQSLTAKKFKIIYFTRSNSDLDLSNEFIRHHNFNCHVDIKTYVKSIYNIIFNLAELSHIQIHETDLLPLFKKIKLKKNNFITIYDVHENMAALYRTFSNRIKPIKELAIYLRHLQENRYLKYVDKIILANHPISTNPYINMGIPISIIENFPELKYFKMSSISVRKPNSIIYHGHLGPERGIYDLVKAMVSVVNDLKNAKLTLIGTFRTKKFRSQIYSLINELNLEQSIEILDQIPHEEIWSYLTTHKVGVVPFRETPLTVENTPTKLFEMMIAGLEVVSSDLPPIRHFVNSSIHWSVPGDALSLAGAIINACKTSDHSKADKNKKLIKENYNWEKNKDRYLSLFYS